MEVVAVTIRWDDGSMMTLENQELLKWISNAKRHSFDAVPPGPNYKMAIYWPVWEKIEKGT